MLLDVQMFNPLNVPIFILVNITEEEHYRNRLVCIVLLDDARQETFTETTLKECEGSQHQNLLL